MNNPPFIEALIAIQQERQLNDDAMAKTLGVCRATWSLTRRDKVVPGMRLIKGAYKAYPELQEQITAAINTAA